MKKPKAVQTSVMMSVQEDERTVHCRGSLARQPV